MPSPRVPRSSAWLALPLLAVVAAFTPGLPRAGQPGEVAVRGARGRYIAGAYVTTAEVVNRTGAPVYDVEVQVTFTGVGGRTLGTGTADVLLTRIDPGGAAPVMGAIRSAPAGIVSQTVAVKRFSRTGRVAVRPVTIELAQVIRGITGPVVTGRARNQTGSPLADVKVVAWYRDSTGKVTGVYSKLLTSRAGPDGGLQR